MDAGPPVRRNLTKTSARLLLARGDFREQPGEVVAPDLARAIPCRGPPAGLGLLCDLPLVGGRGHQEPCRIPTLGPLAEIGVRGADEVPRALPEQAWPLGDLVEACQPVSRSGSGSSSC